MRKLGGKDHAERMIMETNTITGTCAYKVYGADGHRYRESFCDSWHTVWNNGSNRLTVLNSDRTGTNEYSIVIIKCPEEIPCKKCGYTVQDRELEAQLNDGFGENSRYGRVEPIRFKLFQLTDAGIGELMGEPKYLDWAILESSEMEMLGKDFLITCGGVVLNEEDFF